MDYNYLFSEKIKTLILSLPSQYTEALKDLKETHDNSVGEMNDKFNSYWYDIAHNRKDIYIRFEDTEKGKAFKFGTSLCDISEKTNVTILGTPPPKH